MARRRFSKKLIHYTRWAFGVFLHVLDVGVAAIWSFVCNWFVSRPYREILWGLPAVIVALALSLVLIGSGRSSSDLAVRYRESAAQALERGDTRAADLWLTKVVLLDPDEPSYLYSLGMTADRDGHADQARRIMGGIAPEEGEGYPDAHFWLAEDLMRGNRQMTPELQRSLEHHLTSALRSPRVAGDAHGWLGLLYLESGDYEAALYHLGEAAESQPELGIRLWEVYTLKEQRSQAVLAVEKALEHFSQIVEEDPRDTEARLYSAECLTLLGRFEETEEILQEGLPYGDLRVSQRLSGFYLLMFDLWIKDGSPAIDALAALHRLETADELIPNDPQVLNRMSQVAVTSDTARDRVRQLMKQKVAQGQDTAFVHFVFGVLAERDNNYDEATLHYERALKEGLQTMETMNNLAWALANRDPPKLDQALQLAEAALQVAPNDPAVRAVVLDTRGQILAKLGRWDDCISDLEKALPFFLGTDPAPLQLTLAQAYENLGILDVAEAYRLRAPQSPETTSKGGD